VLLGIESYDAEDLRLASSPDFWRMIKERRIRGQSFPLAEVEARLLTPRRKSKGKRVPANKADKHS
jgi:hypothetical protein